MVWWGVTFGCYTCVANYQRSQSSATHLSQNTLENNFNQSYETIFGLMLLLQMKYTVADPGFPVGGRPDRVGAALIPEAATF